MGTYTVKKRLSSKNFKGFSKSKTPIAKTMIKAKKCIYCNVPANKYVIEHMHQHALRLKKGDSKPPEHQGCFRGPACYACNAKEREALKSVLRERKLTTKSFKDVWFSPGFFNQQAEKMKTRYSCYKNIQTSYLRDVLDGTEAEKEVRKQIKF